MPTLSMNVQFLDGGEPIAPVHNHFDDGSRLNCERCQINSMSVELYNVLVAMTKRAEMQYPHFESGNGAALLAQAKTTLAETQRRMHKAVLNGE